MNNAMYACENGESVRRAAAMYGVPKSTLHDHVSGKILMGAKSGRDPYLTIKEEEELASFLMQTAKIGYPHTRKQVFSLVQQILDDKGIQTTITNGWWERFRQRHPNLTLRSAVSLSYARAMASDSDMLLRYYDMLEECLQSNKIYDVPQRIYNCDETGLPLNPKCQKVVDQIGSKNPSYLTGGDKSQLTVLACTNACGQAIPPFVVFDRKSLNKKWTEGEVPGTLYGLSSNGWMTSDLFYFWFQCHFLEYIPPARPVLLLLDGHSSHYCPETIKLAAESKVIVFALPPHTTHITQPLDKGCFAPLKAAWREECHDFSTKNPGRVVTRVEFCEVFSKSWHKAVTPHNIIASFKATGICPFNKAVINLKKDDSFSSFHPESLAQRTGLAYIPLYSPSHTQKHPLNESSEYTHQRPVSPVLSCSPSAPQSLSPIPSSVSNSEEGLLNSTASAKVPLRQATSISNFLIPNIPPSELPTKHTKSAGKVLTSMENLQLIEERQKKKEEEARKKEERKRKREEKARLKQEQKIAKEKKKKGLAKKIVHWSDSAYDNDDCLVDTPFLYDSTESSDVSHPKKQGKQEGKVQPLHDVFLQEDSSHQKYPPIKERGKQAAIKGLLDDSASLSSNDNVGDYPRRSTTYRSQERPRVTGVSTDPGLGLQSNSQNSKEPSSRSSKRKGKPPAGPIELPPAPELPLTDSQNKEPHRSSRRKGKTGFVELSSDLGFVLASQNKDDSPFLSTRSRKKQGVTGLSTDPGLGLQSNSQNSKEPSSRSSKRKGKPPAGPTALPTAPELPLTDGQNKEPRRSSRRKRKTGFAEDPGFVLASQNKEDSPCPSMRSREKRGADSEIPKDSEVLPVNTDNYPRRSTRRKAAEVSKLQSDQINQEDTQSSVVRDQNLWHGVTRRKGKQASVVLMNSKPIVISDSDRDLDIDWWIQDLFLNQRDCEILQTGKELTDNIINAAQTLLSEQYPNLKGFQNTCLGHHLDFKPILRCIPSVQILHTGSSEHWLCVSCCGNGVIQVMDSLGSFMALNLATVLQICKIYSAPKDHSTLKLRKLPVQQQCGTLDCGLFAVAYAVEVCMGNSPADVSFDQKRMRFHLYTCLSDGVMSPFPKMSRAREYLPRPTDRSLNVKVYCLCKLPEEYDSFMIECESCKQWYHCSCVKLSPYKIPNRWQCSLCSTQ